MHEGTLVIVTRRPARGTTKKRLIPHLGEEGATKLAAAFLEDLVRRFGNFPVRRRVVAWTGGDADPDHAVAPAFEEREQGPGDLGERLVRLYHELEAPVVFIGSDAPSIPVESLRQAFLGLADKCDVMLQPALDGGFTLGGFRTDPGPVIYDVPWGTDAVLSTILDRCAPLPYEVGLLDPWYDVDVVADLRLLRAHLRTLEGRENHPRCTAEVLERIQEMNA